MLTQLDLGSTASGQHQRAKGLQEKLLAELFLRPHFELTAFFSSLDEYGSMETLCCSPLADQSLLQSLHEKVRSLCTTLSSHLQKQNYLR